MRKHLIALVTALALCFSLTACTFGTPETVGSIGEVEFSAGLYLLIQFQAYHSATSYASEEQGKLSVSAFLKQTISVAGDATVADGDYLASDYVAQKTEDLLEYYAAVETEFAALGGELSAEEIASNQQYADYFWPYQEALYTANGFDESTLVTYLCNQSKAYQLLTLKYGKDGPDALAQEEVERFVAEQVFYGQYFSISTTDSSTNATYEEDVLNRLVAKAEEAAASLSEGADIDEVTTLTLPALYEIAGLDYDEETNKKLNSTLYTYSDLESSYSEEVAQAFQNCAVGQAIAVRMGSALYVFQRLDVAGHETYDEDYLNNLAVQDLRSDALEAWLYEQGAGYAHNLDGAAMRQMPASKITVG